MIIIRALACTAAILDLHVYSHVHFLYINKNVAVDFVHRYTLKNNSSVSLYLLSVLAHSYSLN